MEMTYERAAEILDPEHREYFDSLETVKEACRMGMAALKTRIPKSTFEPKSRISCYCPTCGSKDFLSNDMGRLNAFCGNCGQALDWEV